MSDRRHRPELDGLRAIGVAAVFLFHSGSDSSLSGGFLGVDLFFVLSAYLITTILTDELHESGSLNLTRFYWRRFLRLMPPLLLLLAAYLAIAPLLWPGYPHLRDALITGAYFSDYSYTFWQAPFYLRHTWSLAVEEHFYLLWPLILAPLLARRSPVSWLVLAYVAATLWRASFDADANSYYYRFDSHMTGLILGSAIALTPRPTISPLVATAALGVLIVLFTTARIADARSTITSAELVSALLVLYAVGRPVGLVGTILRHPVAQFIGTRSYAMYLWHFPVIFALDITHTVSMGTAIALAITVGMSELSYRTVEAWSRHVKSREAAVRSAQLRA